MRKENWCHMCSFIPFPVLSGADETNLFLLNDESVSRNDAGALNRGVDRVQINGLRRKADEHLESSGWYASKLGKLRLQLRHFIVGRETVDDLLTRFGLYPKNETCHDRRSLRLETAVIRTRTTRVFWHLCFLLLRRRRRRRHGLNDQSRMHAIVHRYRDTR